MFYKVINKETKEVNVGFGTNTEFYKSIGMIEGEVEQGYDGVWYIKGYAPQKPLEELKAEEIVEYQKYLVDTDYIVTKISEAIVSGDQQLIDELKSKYADIISKRVEARQKINELREEISV